MESTDLGRCASEPSADELAKELQQTRELLNLERRRSSGYVMELQRLKEQNLAVQKQVEQEEEFITNKLMKRLQQLKNEKQVLANEVEQEEEYLVNTLQKRLHKLNGEKVDLENQLEVEQEYIVNKLQKKLDELRLHQTRLNREKVDLENQLEAEQEYIVNKLQKQVERLAKEKAALQQEKNDLQRQVTELAMSAERLNRDKVRMEAEKEMEEENIVNRLQRQIEALILNYKALEAKLEARGFSMKDLAPLHIDATTEWAFCRSPTRRNSRDSNASGSSRRSSGVLMGGPMHSLPSPYSPFHGSPHSRGMSLDPGLDRSMFRQGPPSPAPSPSSSMQS